MEKHDNDDFEEFKENLKGKKVKTVTGILIVIAFIVMIGLVTNIVEDVDANDILVVKALGTGEIKIYTEPGWVMKWFGSATHFKKSYQYSFEAIPNGNGAYDLSKTIRVRFNDNGHGNISGSVRIDMPLDKKKILEIYTRYNTQNGIEYDLIRTVFDKSVYMVGQLMSSTESSSAKRSMLLSYIEDQAQNGVFRTITKDVKTKDPLTGAEKTVSIVELIPDPSAPAGFVRQEESPLKYLGFKSSNLSINNIFYDKSVEQQIHEQQKLYMEIQVSMAAAKKAEQKALTAAKEGEAIAAKAKWEQEAIKAKYVTEAEQKRDVAKLEKDAAEYKKQRDILEGQGEAEKRKLIMFADGALTLKLQTYEKVMNKFAEEFGKQKWVPEIIIGNGSNSGSNSVANMIDMLSTKTAKDLYLDLGLNKSQKTEIKKINRKD